MSWRDQREFSDRISAWCDHCQKMWFATKKGAKRARKQLHKGNRIDTFRCPVNPGWHNGTLPDFVKRGLISRDQIIRWDKRNG